MNKTFTIKRLFYVFIVSVFILCSCFLTGCAVINQAMHMVMNPKSDNEFARDRITRLTEIEVPMDSELVYYFFEERGFMPGRSSTYIVFQFEREPTDWLNENSFQKRESDEFEQYFSGGWDTFPDDMEEIPQEFLPNFEDTYFWLTTEKCIPFVYAPQSLLLMVQIPGY